MYRKWNKFVYIHRPIYFHLQRQWNQQIWTLTPWALMCYMRNLKWHLKDQENKAVCTYVIA